MKLDKVIRSAIALLIVVVFIIAVGALLWFQRHGHRGRRGRNKIFSISYTLAIVCSQEMDPEKCRSQSESVYTHVL